MAICYLHPHPNWSFFVPRPVCSVCRYQFWGPASVGNLIHILKCIIWYLFYYSFVLFVLFCFVDRSTLCMSLYVIQSNPLPSQKRYKDPFPKCALVLWQQRKLWPHNKKKSSHFEDVLTPEPFCMQVWSVLYKCEQTVIVILTVFLVYCEILVLLHGLFTLLYVWMPNGSHIHYCHSHLKDMLILQYRFHCWVKSDFL